MKQNVHIQVEGVQWDDLGQSSTTTTLAQGLYSCPGGNHFLRFEELMEGIEEPVQNLIRLTPGEIYVKKSGPLAVRFTFLPERETAGTYHSPYGELPFTLYTRSLSLEERADSLTALIDYDLSFLSQEPLRHRITIRVRES